MKLIFFDIDGTLLSPSQAGRRAMTLAAGELAQRDVDLQIVGSFAGRTDRGIMADILALVGLAQTEAAFLQLSEGYLRHLGPSLSEDPGEVLPGVAEILRRISQSPHLCAAGLLTGNLASGARQKLICHALETYFSFGGYGDRHADRNEVAVQALTSAKVRLQRQDFAEVLVIGDTPADIACARAIGATSVAVCTGKQRRESLAHADHVFDNFGDVDNVSHILGLG